MTVSSRFGALGAIDGIAAPWRSLMDRRASGRQQPTPEKVNETATVVSERVHLREIIVTDRRGARLDRTDHCGLTRENIDA
jgi:hypothetical protein